MAKAGINKTALAKLGCEALCFMSDPETAEAAKLSGTTRALLRWTAQQSSESR